MGGGVGSKANRSLSPLVAKKKPTAHFWGLWQTMPHSKAEIWGQSPALANHRTQGEGPSLIFAPKIWVLPQNLHPKLGRGDPNLAQRLGRPMKRPFFDPPKNSDLKGDLFSTFLENFKNPKNSELAERAASQSYEKNCLNPLKDKTKTLRNGLGASLPM